MKTNKLSNVHNITQQNRNEWKSKIFLPGQYWRSSIISVFPMSLLDQDSRVVKCAWMVIKGLGCIPTEQRELKSIPRRGLLACFPPSFLSQVGTSTISSYLPCLCWEWATSQQAPRLTLRGLKGRLFAGTSECGWVHQIRAGWLTSLISEINLKNAWQLLQHTACYHNQHNLSPRQ